jgi:hypothetical protein
MFNLPRQRFEQRNCGLRLSFVQVDKGLTEDRGSATAE